MSLNPDSPEHRVPQAAMLSVVAIDGPAGSGKSTAARGLAARLGWRHLDTGALYRGVALALLRRGVLAVGADGVRGDDAAIAAALDGLDLELSPAGQVVLDGVAVADELRSEPVARAASFVAARDAVRAHLLPVQRRFAATGPVVCEGRDMATVVFPDARFKFWIDADVGVRAARRHAELRARGDLRPPAEVRQDLEARDRDDAGRELAPLLRAADAELVDTTDLDAAAVVDRLATRVREGLA